MCVNVTVNVAVQFRLDYALSREQSNKKGGKMYIQDKASPPVPTLAHAAPSAHLLALQAIPIS